MKVLLFSNDLMPFGELPTSGGGLRCFQLMRGLESHGIDVIASMPGFTYLAEKYRDQIPEEYRPYLWRFDTQDDIYRSVKPDAVLFASNWDHYNLSVRLDVPLVVDLHGSRLIETSMWGRPASGERKVQTLARADCLLAAGQRQRSYFYGWLMQAGRVPEHEHFIRYVPISLGPDRPEHLFPGNDDPSAPRFVSGGGWFPWQNQSKAIFTLCKEIAATSRGSIEIYGSPHERQGNTAEESLIFEIYREVQRLAERSDRIRVKGYVGRRELIEIYRRASVAVEVMEYNLERELAFTTRTIEYLWCGLPVMYNDYAEISQHIRDYDAGWAINPVDEQAIAQTVREIMERPDLVARKGENAHRLVRDRFTWDRTIEPLVEFLRHPVRARQVTPVLGTVYARPAYLQARGTQAEIAASGEIAQRFYLPADNVSAVEVVLSPTGAGIADGGAVELRLEGPAGRVLTRRRVAISSLRKGSRVAVPLPVLLRPAGGEELVLRICPQGGAASAFSVQGLVEGGYPLLTHPHGGFEAKTLLNEPCRAAGVALGFVPEDHSSLYQAKVLVRRAVVMVKQGEWRRLARALQKRLAAKAYTARRRALNALQGG